MKETKVYVDELPESCKKCVYSQINLAFGVETRICNLQYGFISANNDKFPNCPLQSLKQHDRELVKEVCEKIKQYFNENLGNCEEYHCCGFSGKQIEDIYGFIENLQKEIEK